MSFAKFRKLSKGSKNPSPPSPKVSPEDTLIDDAEDSWRYTCEAHGIYIPCSECETANS